ncbi:MAG: YggT family protein [Pseudomonadota bacterium]
MSLLIYALQFGFGLLAFLFLLRFLLQLCRASFYNPISQAIHRATRVPVDALARVLPTVGRCNTASLLLVLCCEWLAIVATLTLAGVELPGLRLLVWGVLGAAALLVNLYFYGIFALVILSWIAPQSGHPAAALVGQLVEPVLAPARRLIPPLGGLDLSPMLVLFALGGMRILLRNLAGAASLIGGAVPGL